MGERRKKSSKKSRERGWSFLLDTHTRKSTHCLWDDLWARDGISTHGINRPILDIKVHLLQIPNWTKSRWSHYPIIASENFPSRASLSLSLVYQNQIYVLATSNLLDTPAIYLIIPSWIISGMKIDSDPSRCKGKSWGLSFADGSLCQ